MKFYLLNSKKGILWITVVQKVVNVVMVDVVVSAVIKVNPVWAVVLEIVVKAIVAALVNAN